jgi:hypothetical protein
MGKSARSAAGTVLPLCHAGEKTTRAAINRIDRAADRYCPEFLVTG